MNADLAQQPATLRRIPTRPPKGDVCAALLADGSVSRMTQPTFADVEAAAHRITGAAHRTPVATSRSVNARTGAELFFKCENLQRAGAFKFRGAYNALSRLSADERRRGVVKIGRA